MSKDLPPDDSNIPLPSSLWEALNLPEPPKSDDRFAPEVDRALLLRLVRNELVPEQVKAVYRLIYAFDSWKKAYSEIVIEEFRSAEE